MIIRKATITDAGSIADLFYDTVTNVNTRDYTPEQIAAWSGRPDKEGRFAAKISEQYFIVAEDEGGLTGFASLTTDGYLDFMFVHKDKQGRGIATTLYRDIERQALSLGLAQITADVSITARPFFLRRGFMLIVEQQVQIGDVALTNFKMIKKFFL